MKNLTAIIFSICLFTVAPIAAQNVKVSTHIPKFNHENVSNGDYFYNEARINQFVPYSHSLRYNRVEGLFLGFGSDLTNDNFGLLHVEGLTLNGQIGYSTGLKEWQYRAEANKKLSRSLVFGAQIINVSTTEDGWRTNQLENSVTALITGYDFQDYYKAEGFQFYTEINLSKKIQVSGSYNATTFSSLANNKDYSLFKGGNMGRVNPAIDNSTDRLYQENFGLNLTINKKPSYKRVFNSKLEIKTELADVGKLKNDFSYNKFQVASTNYLKLDRNTLLKTRTMVGSITGIAPGFKQFALGGIGTMRASGYKFYSGNRMILNNAELVFGSIGSIRMNQIETDGVSLSVFLDSGWTTNYLSDNKDPFDGFSSFSTNKLTHNIGAGIGLGSLRFELATPFADSQGYTAFWVRFNPTF